MKIAILDGYTSTMGEFDWKGIEAFGEVAAYDRTPEDKIIERARGAEAVLTNKVPMFEEQICALPELRYIGVLATGYNNVDLRCAKSRGIAVTNIAEYGTDSVAQAVFALLFGNSLGIVTRLFRANAGYYFGLFSKETAKELLFWNFATTSFFALITLAAAALPLIAEAM